MDGVTPKNFRDYLGYRSCRKNRVVGSYIAVVHGGEAGWEDEDDTRARPWYTCCETHVKCIPNDTRAAAVVDAATPWEWCPACAKIYRKT